MSNKLSAVIITGHESRHLKTPKQSLPFGDSNVLARTLDAYLETGFQQVVLVVGSAEAEIRDALGKRSEAVHVVVADSPEATVAAQLALGFRTAVSSDGFAVGLADQPLLTAEIIGSLADRFIQTEKKILVPVALRTVGHPCFVHPSLSPEFLKLPPDGNTWTVISQHPDDVEDVSMHHTAVIRNIDDQEDYHLLLQMAGLPVPETTPGQDEDEIRVTPPAPAAVPPSSAPAAGKTESGMGAGTDGGNGADTPSSADLA